MIALCLDQASIKTGFAVVDTDSKLLIATGEWKLPPKALLIDRITSLAECVAERITLHNVQELVLEDHRFMRQRSADTNLAMAAALIACQSAAQVCKVPFYYQGASEVKRHLTGNGKATKEDIIAAVGEKVPTLIEELHEAGETLSEDHADAVAHAIVWLDKCVQKRAKEAEKRVKKKVVKLR